MTVPDTGPQDLPETPAHTIVVPNSINMVALLGPGDEHLRHIEPEDFLPRNPFPLDAQRMGIDRWSDDAGMIAIASSLDSRKLSHKIVAWVMLLAVTSWLLMQLWFELSS